MLDRMERMSRSGDKEPPRAAGTAAADAGKPADGAARPGRRRHGAGAERTRPLIRKQQRCAARPQAAPGFPARPPARQAGRPEHWRLAAGPAGPARPAEEAAGRTRQARHGAGSARPARATRPARRAGHAAGPGPARSGRRSRRRRGRARSGRASDGRCHRPARRRNAEGAVDSQGKALEALRKGAQSLAEAMQQGDGDQPGDGPGNPRGRRAGRAADSTDPLDGRCATMNSPATTP